MLLTPLHACLAKHIVLHVSTSGHSHPGIIDWQYSPVTRCQCGAGGEPAILEGGDDRGGGGGGQGSPRSGFKTEKQNAFSLHSVLHAAVTDERAPTAMPNDDVSRKSKVTADESCDVISAGGVAKSVGTLVLVLDIAYGTSCARNRPISRALSRTVSVDTMPDKVPPDTNSYNDPPLI